MCLRNWIKTCLAIGLTGSSALSISAERISLQEHAHLWQLIDSSALESRPISTNSKGANAQSIAPSASLLKHHESAIRYTLDKSISGYEHYSASYQGFPILNSHAVLIKDHSGIIQQGLGHLVANIEEDIPIAENAFFKTEYEAEDAAMSAHTHHQILKHVKTEQAIYIDKEQAKAVYKIYYRFIHPETFQASKPTFIVDAQTLNIIEQWDGLAKFQDETLIKGGGIAGNSKLGVVCFSPAPNTMQNCTQYEWDHPDRFPGDEGLDYATHGGELVYQRTLPTYAYFNEFNGYPFIVKKSGDQCTLENDYVKTVEYVGNDAVANDTAFQYTCDDSGELFRESKNSEFFWEYFSLEPLSTLHFYGGLTMQMYSKYLHEIFPDGGYQLNQLKQRAIYPAMSSFWNYEGDGYVDYGWGSGITYYQFATMDVVAHEASHAVNAWNVNQSDNGLDRAFNEGFSDLAAMALKDYFAQHASGSYTEKDVYQKLMNSKKWWMAWDVLVANKGLRYFETPSDDWHSINDARDFDNHTSYFAAGPFRKFFHELTQTHNWSIENAFKLTLGAAVRCFYPNMGYNGLATCLLNEVQFTIPDVVLRSDRFSQVETVLHSVGMIPQSSQSSITPLSFTYEQFYEKSLITLDPTIDAAKVSEVNIIWNTQSPEANKTTWTPNNSDVQVPQFEWTYPFGENSYQIKVSVLMQDQTRHEGYRYIYMNPHYLECTPTQFSSNNEITGLSILNTPVDLALESNQFYKFMTYEGEALNHSQVDHFTLNGNFLNKHLIVAIDKDRDGLFRLDEMDTIQSLTGQSVDIKLSDLNSVSPGPVVVRLAVGNNNSMPACYTSGNGMVIDILVNSEKSLPPPIVNFNYEILSGTNVKFTADLTGVDQTRQPSFQWRYDSQTISSEPEFTYDFNEAGKYAVKLTIAYAADGQSSSFEKQVNVTSGYCIPSVTKELDKVYINSVISNYEYQYPILNSVGSINSADGYRFHESDTGDVYMVMPANQAVMFSVQAHSWVWNGLSRMRATLWIDLNRNGVFEVNENNSKLNGNSSNFELVDNSCWSDCDVKSTVSISIPDDGFAQPYRARLRVERFSSDYRRRKTVVGSNACTEMYYGETEDFDVYMN